MKILISNKYISSNFLLSLRLLVEKLILATLFAVRMMKGIEFITILSLEQIMLFRRN